jgi:2,4-dienoyl-CoA reductase-like NADH-dependent reductase (Old Yellow Enzyme family)
MNMVAHLKIAPDFLLETVKAFRYAMPDSMPLFVRISATDWTGGLGS